MQIRDDGGRTPDQGKAVHARHLNIRDQNFRAKPFNGLQRLFAIDADGDDPERAGALGQLLNKSCNGWFILSNQNSDRLHTDSPFFELERKEG